MSASAMQGGHNKSLFTNEVIASKTTKRRKT